MALLAEEIVEEWLNRQGYFTIRGIKIGVHEIDLLAIKHTAGGIECRHIEVQASMRPISPISHVPKKDQKDGRAKNSARRTESELAEGVKEWVDKKFHLPQKKALMTTLWDGTWSSELVVNVVKFENELVLIESHGVKVMRLNKIISELAKSQDDKFFIQSASGADLVDLINMSSAEQIVLQKKDPA